MDRKLFRQKSIDRVSSPDELDTYIKAANPKVWLLLAAIILFLVGVIIWGCVGKIQSTMEVGCVIGEDGTANFVISEKDFGKLTKASYGKIKWINSDETFYFILPNLTDEKCAAQNTPGAVSDYVFHLSRVGEGEWFHILPDAEMDFNKFAPNGILPVGDYKAVIVLEEISPIKFIIDKE